MAGIQNGSKIKYKSYVEGLDAWITYRIDMIAKKVEVLQVNTWVESDLSFDEAMAKVQAGELFSC